MKTISLLLMVMTVSTYGQGMLIYDQQSATNQAGGDGARIQLDQPMGQSFVPTLSSVGFVQLELLDFPTNGLGTTVFVNLWSGSISNGTLLSSTDTIFIPDGAFNLVTNFFFSTPAMVTPGTTYYFQPYAQSGDTTRIDVIGSQVFNYSGGTFYFHGAPDPNNSDLWFREGMIVPEPSAAMLGLIGGGLFLCARRKHKKHSPL